MHDRLELLARGFKPRGERVGMDELAQRRACEVAPLVALAQPVTHRHRLVRRGERGHDVRADEAGTTGDEDHGRRARMFRT
jgi:hypothetical protein